VRRDVLTLLQPATTPSHHATFEPLTTTTALEHFALAQGTHHPQIPRRWSVSTPARRSLQSWCGEHDTGGGSDKLSGRLGCWRGRHSLLTALLMPLLIGGNPKRRRHAQSIVIKIAALIFFCLSTGRYDTVVTMPIATIPCAQFSIRSTAARCEQPSARGGSRGTWALDADRLGNHALMMQRSKLSTQGSLSPWKRRNAFHRLARRSYQRSNDLWKTRERKAASTLHT
jgi:hypothetical protein